MMSSRLRLWINASKRYRFGHNRPFCSNSKPTNTNNGSSSDKAKVDEAGPLTHYDSYRDLQQLDFMSATKILLTTPPSEKKFGLDFHLVQLFFVCLPSLAVYLVAMYARSEMRKMDAEIERRKHEIEAKAKEEEQKAAEEKAQSDPHLLEVKARLERLEDTVKEFVVGSKKESATSKNQEGNREESARPSPDNNGRRSEPNKSTDKDLQSKKVSKEREQGSDQQETKQLAVSKDVSQKDRKVTEGGSPSQDGKK